MNKKVSIITPCYNGEKFLHSYFKSILEQTYDNIEVIFIDDGSTDQTGKIVKEYQPALANRGIVFRYTRKENGGIVSALNHGFKLFTGEYLSWTDVDDYMHPDYIEHKINTFEQHPDIDILITRVAYINASNPNEIVDFSWQRPPHDKEDFIKRILVRDGVGFEPGNHMVRTSSFKKFIPSMEIYDGGKMVGGQIQLLLPMVYYGRFLYEDVCLYDYLIYNNNHHLQFKSADQWNKLFEALEKVYKETIQRLHSDNEKQMISYALQAIAKERFETALSYEDVTLLKASYQEIASYHEVTPWHKRVHIICRSRIMLIIYNKLRKLIYRT